MFGSVVAVAFQIIFHAEMHANDFFYFLKIIFDINTSKQSKIYKLYQILAKKKKLIFLKTRFALRSQTVSKCLTLCLFLKFLTFYLIKKTSIMKNIDIYWCLEVRSQINFIKYVCFRF